MRSLLFVPADSERKLAHSLKSGADALILDLEDSVIPANRPSARSRARAFLDETRSTGILRYVRINALASDQRSTISPPFFPESPKGYCCRNACLKSCPLWITTFPPSRRLTGSRPAGYE
jgi:citrate lyase subunit beta/citryl-CoA lyase